MSAAHPWGLTSRQAVAVVSRQLRAMMRSEAAGRIIAGEPPGGTLANAPTVQERRTMLDNRILLTTPTYPYPTLPANDSLTDATAQRFTKGDDVFTVLSHTHCYASHLLAQNIDVPSVVLEYPRWGDFTAEIDKGYPVLGITAFPPHLDNVMKMCRYVRQRSPATKILLGSYGGQAFRAVYDQETQRQYVDHIVEGEGIKWLRSYLGESTDRPIRQTLMPKCGVSPPALTRYPKGSVGMLISGLGCPGGCDFCSTTALFNRKRHELLSPEELIQHFQSYHDQYPDMPHVMVIEEDHFRQPAYLEKTRSHWMASPGMAETLDWFGFGSIDHIGAYAEKYGWDAIPETGIGAIFIGVESKFAGDHGYDKRDDVDARVVFEKLHSMGIRTIGAWMCGFDFHDHSNIYEDLNYFVSLCPTYQQLTRVSPFPGTPLWERLKEEGRVNDVPWEDVHFWSGAQQNVALESHETLNLTEYGYDLLYQTWGPSILRRLDVQLSGYAYCLQSKTPMMRQHRAKLHARHCAALWTNLAAIDRFAPNGIVRRRARKADERFRGIIGEPTPLMEALSLTIEAQVTAFKIRELFDPMNRHPREEPFVRYHYDKNGSSDSPIPYRSEKSPPSPKVRRQMRREEVGKTVMGLVARALRFTRPKQGNPLLDDFVERQLGGGMTGLGF
jgi:hypothetical protein